MTQIFENKSLILQSFDNLWLCAKFFHQDLKWKNLE